MIKHSIPFRGWREDEEPVEQEDLLNDALVAFGFKSWAELATHLECINIYQHTKSKNTVPLNRKYIIKLSHRLMEKLNDVRYEYEKRIEALESELRGDNGLCRHCPMRMKHDD